MNVDKVIIRKEGEAVLRVVRRYWLTFLPKAFVAFVLFGVPLFFMVPLFRTGTPGKVAFLALLALGFLYGIRVLVEWRWNVFIVTTRRVVDVDQRGVFRRTVSEAPYDRIQDVSFSVKGVWGTVFRFGSVVVQTAGTNVNLELSDVKDPKAVHHLITETMSVRQANDAVGTGRAEELLQAASSLSDAEARAFLVALQGAVRRPGSSEGSRRSADDVEAFMRDDEDEA